MFWSAEAVKRFGIQFDPLTNPRPYAVLGGAVFSILFATKGKGSVEPSTNQQGRRTGNNLEKIAPGLYADDTGLEYFYLTGMYVCMTQRILKYPGLYTPAFVVDLLVELRASFYPFGMELMD